MDIRRIDDDVYVSGQLFAEDIPALAEFGISMVICNRPDREGADQPDFGALEDALRAAGMACYYIPVTPPLVSEEAVVEMVTALKEKNGPLLAYCRSGARSNMLYQMAKARLDSV